MTKQKIILGITGSIAAKKALALTGELKKFFDVKIVLSKGAENFLSVDELKECKVTTHHNDELFADDMLHIQLAKEADIILIAPATANIIAKLAGGFADCLLSTICIASDAKIIVVPAMNKQMWGNLFVQKNIAILEKNNIKILGPAYGLQACGDVGYGRMLEPSDITDYLSVEGSKKVLAGKRICITAGATIERLDPVRYISNFSSGKMGYELANAAETLGAKVDLILANSNVKVINQNINVIQVESADKMYAAARHSLKKSDIFIGAAAVVDYKPAHQERQKIKKHNKEVQLSLVQNTDIISSLKNEFPNTFMVGFAAETENLIENAKAKMLRKKLDMIIGNDVANNKVFNKDESEVYIITPDDAEIHIPLSTKKKISYEICKNIAATFI